MLLYPFACMQAPHALIACVSHRAAQPGLRAGHCAGGAGRGPSGTEVVPFHAAARAGEACMAQTTNAPCGASVLLHATKAYQKNCRRASRMFGLSLTKVRALELYFLLSTIT